MSAKQRIVKSSSAAHVQQVSDRLRKQLLVHFGHQVGDNRILIQNGSVKALIVERVLLAGDAIVVLTILIQVMKHSFGRMVEGMGITK